MPLLFRLIQSGLVDEGMAVVTSIRERYDGERRNPGTSSVQPLALRPLRWQAGGTQCIQWLCFRHGKGRDQVRSVRLLVTFRCLWSLDSGWE